MPSGKNVIITGATGMIGRIILNKCLEDPEIRLVTVIGRNSTGLSHEKLREVVHADFENFYSLEHYFRDQHITFYCLGAYTGSVPTDLFRKITVDYTIAFAKTLIRNSRETSFVFLSGAGADLKEKSRLSFARFKGMAENALTEMNFSHLYIFRPAYIYPVEQRKEPNFSYRLMRWLYPLFNKVMPASAITSHQLGHAMFHTGKEKLIPSGILENREILEIARQIQPD